MGEVSNKTLRRRRTGLAVLFSLIILIVGLSPGFLQQKTTDLTDTKSVLSDVDTGGQKALDVLGAIEVKGRAPKTGYSRSEYGAGWAVVGGCDIRNIMLARNMESVEKAEDGCIVLKGVLQDPYTGKTIDFVRGKNTSDDVQIDHVVALSDSWQKGAQNLTNEQRLQFANDPLNLLPVDGSANQQKSDSDSASWLPPNKNFRCRYVARQIAVKSKYGLWVTEAEKSTMKRVLNGCGEQVLPVQN